MINNIHRWLLVRLALVWAILSLVSGGFVHYFTHARLDEHIMNMAKSDASTFIDEFVEYSQSPSVESLTLFKQKIGVVIENDSFVAVRFYGTDFTRIAEKAGPLVNGIMEKIPPQRRESSLNLDSVGEKMTINGETYIQVIFPIDNGEGVRVGYLDGIYHAPREIVAEIRHQSFGSIILVVFTVFMTSLVMYPIIIRLNRKLLAYSNTLALTNVGMLKVLGSAIAKRDSDTNIHNYRVTLYSVRLGEKLGLSATAMQGLIKGAFLHDVGKIAISDTILLKPGKLSDEEFEIMKTHVRHGQDIVSGFSWLKDAEDVVRGHHEKFDGSGYPGRLAGDEIPRNARIFAFADVFDALTSRRPYKEPFSLPASIEIIRQLRGNHLDPALVEMFLEHAEKLYEEICTEDGALLKKKLEECIKTYFQ
ncbi:MAG: hypothetical protein ACD_75C00389G0001 [uncultured bacterium]|nr:MAG: hypothetical protein ACD_75C00389G0001 [uncultured bacterium]